MRTTTLGAALIATGLGLATGAPVQAYVAGGGPARTDCFAAWQVTTAERGPNRGTTGVDCQDGDPTCDLDGQANGSCTFGVSICASMAGAGCEAGTTTAVALGRRGQKLGVVPPPLPTSTPTCGAATIVIAPLRGTHARRKPSRLLTLRMVATAAGKDRDTLRLRCVPNAGANQCPPNPAGGPRELAMAVAPTGTDLDNGTTGLSHDFPVPEGAALRMCLAGCDPTVNPACAEDDAATDRVNSATFGPPLPLFTAGVPVCVVNRFGSPALTGGTANLATGAVAGDLHLLSDIFLSSPTAVCPRCSAGSIGGAGTCDSGRRAGQACRTQSILQVVNAVGDERYALSADCPPSGIAAGTLTLTLPLTTGTTTLAGPRACGAAQDDLCRGGTCDAACTGAACVSTDADGRCLDVKGGVSQVCCSTNTALACFPTGSGTGAIVRTGSAATPVPAFPDPGYPKTADATLVATFCEGATGSVAIDGVSGLPGPGALVLPVRQQWVQ